MSPYVQPRYTPTAHSALTVTGTLVIRCNEEAEQICNAHTRMVATGCLRHCDVVSNPVLTTLSLREAGAGRPTCWADALVSWQGPVVGAINAHYAVMPSLSYKLSAACQALAATLDRLDFL